MGLTRKVPAEMAELTQEQTGEPEGRNRFASAKFKVRLQPQQDEPAGEADEEPSD